MSRPGGVDVRPAALADTAAMGRIKVNGWRAAYRGLVPDGDLDAMDPHDWDLRFAAMLVDAEQTLPGTHIAYVAVVDEQVVGYVFAGPYRGSDLPDAGEVYALYVDPDCWRGGAGARLLSAAQGFLAAQGHPEAALWVLETNQAGQAFYRAQGWRPDGARAAVCEVDGLPELRYRTRLA